jgi:hypothetical protein
MHKDPPILKAASGFIFAMRNIIFRKQPYRYWKKIPGVSSAQKYPSMSSENNIPFV